MKASQQWVVQNTKREREERGARRSETDDFRLYIIGVVLLIIIKYIVKALRTTLLTTGGIRVLYFILYTTVVVIKLDCSCRIRN